MTSIDGTILDFRQLDRLALGTTSIHRIDARAKVLVTLVFVATVSSFGPHEVTALFPFFIFPAVMVGAGGLPAGFVVKKVLIVIPFAILVGMFNPLFDREVLVRIGPVAVSGGWISCASIMIRAILTVGAAVILAGTTGFAAICRALERLGMPRVFAGQLMFLYRYIFVLAEEGSRASRARELRSFGQRGMGMRPFGSLVGHLLLRTWARAERVHMAMLARGFTGEFHSRLPSRFGLRGLLFLAGWTALFALFRFHNLSQFLGAVVVGLAP